MMDANPCSIVQHPALFPQFTSKERDAETGLDYFLARYYSGAQGRFLSPDEFKGGIVDPFTGQQVGKPGPLPYADIWDPQTLNKYGYVRNNALRYIDPDGHSLLDSILNKFKRLPPPPPPPKPPVPPPFALLVTNKSKNTTTLFINTPKEAKTVQIETRVKVDKSWLNDHPGADGSFTTTAIAGVSNRHAGEDAYGPNGAYIDVNDTRQRNIHGGGTGLDDPQAARQGWQETNGCTRGQNEDVIKLGQEITGFQKSYPTALPIPYRRE